ncbi:hypothetical protein [Herminiimonas aquatilis]|uniref:hypothetical protein n=1 Tax=Herminiimonas aquatilis TaxID=345342 RepID=UPI0036D3C49A
MPKISSVMGSASWASEVFSSAPARRLKGHSRRTQAHRFYSTKLQQIMEVQGRNECCTAFAIEYLIGLGLLRRAKPQPFKTDRTAFGSEICPDFLVESTDDVRQLYVIETKSNRFLTRKVNLQLDEYRNRFKEFGIEYLVWTDNCPLNHAVRHHLQLMRVSSNRAVAVSQRESLRKWLASAPQTTLDHFYAAGYDLDCLYASAWDGEVFIPITLPLSPTTPISLSPLNNFKALFLSCENSSDDWWKSLQTV